MSGPVPERLGKYQVMREIGRGSMGTVYLGHDPYTDRNVAIKVAHAEQLNDEEGGERYRKMFFNEAHTAGRLTHPNIIGIYDAGVDGDTCYIVMELVDGGETLKNYCKPDHLATIAISASRICRKWIPPRPCRWAWSARRVICRPSRSPKTI